MFRTILVAIMSVAALVSTGHAQSGLSGAPLTSPDGLWQARYDDGGKRCLLAPSSGKAGFLATRTLDGREAIVIDDPGLSPRDLRRLRLKTGPVSWNAQLKSAKEGSRHVLVMNNPVARFRQALFDHQSLELHVGGARRAAHSLPRLAAAYPLLDDCIREASTKKNEPIAETYIGRGDRIEWKIAELPHRFVYQDGDRRFTLDLSIVEWADGAPKTLAMTGNGTGLASARTALDIQYNAPDVTVALALFSHGTPTFLIGSYTMGAHCCTAVMALTPRDRAIAPVDLGTWDGSFFRVHDIDGDGTDEIDTYDQRFLYAFDSYASSLAAAKILKVSQGKVDDVTEQAAYQGTILRQMQSHVADCYSEARPGVCAGVLGNAARIGLYRSMLAHIPFDRIDAAAQPASLTCSKDECGEEKRFSGFREALQYRLELWGYKTTSSLDPRGIDFFARLAAVTAGFGEGGDGNENGCSLGPTRFRLSPDHAFVTVEGYEYSCRIEKAGVLERSALAFALCDAEGESYASWMTFEKTDSGLLTGFAQPGTIAPSVAPTALSECR